MKIAFVVVFAFFVSMAARSRDLTYKERMAVLASKNHIELSTYFADQIDPQSLPLNEYISFNVLRKSCLPLTLHLNKIEEQNEEFKDQSVKLRVYYIGCMEGTLALGHLYQKNTK